MAYKSDPIAAVIKRLNNHYFLPAIQREFVWKPEQIIQLFDSLMRRYPIGSFLLWELIPENREKWQIYKFIENFKQDYTHNELTEPMQVRDLTLVLDGQQRLTSLLIGLKGSYTTKRKYSKQNSLNAWIPQNLYLDLLKDPKGNDEQEEEGVRYGFRFSPKEDAPISAEHFYFRVGRILNFDNRVDFDKYIETQLDKLPETITRGQQRIFTNNINRLYQMVWEDQSISYHTEQEQDYDRVLDIFVRANNGGTKLSKSDLLLSMVTAKWGDINAREEINEFTEHLNEKLTRKNNFDKDFVLKTRLSLSDLPIQYNVENFNNQSLDKIRANWDRIKKSMIAGIDLINSFGIDRDNLISANTLMPIIYYIHLQKGKNFRGTGAFEVKNAARRRRWLIMILLNHVFSGQSDRILTETRKVLQQNGEDNFPVEILNGAIRRQNRVADFDDEALENILTTNYGNRQTFLILSLLYENKDWGTLEHHIDHIFPQSMFTPKQMREAGILTEKHQTYIDMANRIGNLQLLIASENESKQDKNFEDWLRTRNVDFRAKHLIPQDDSLLKFSQFEKFIVAREKLIKA